MLENISHTGRHSLSYIIAIIYQTWKWTQDIFIGTIIFIVLWSYRQYKRHYVIENCAENMLSIKCT